MRLRKLRSFSKPFSRRAGADAKTGLPLATGRRENNTETPETTMTATVDIKDDIAVITMDDGKANAINPTMLGALHACLDEAEKNAKVVILTGREKRFSGGFDLKVLLETSSEEAYGLVNDGGKLAHRLYDFSLPVIAACSGHAVAMGSFILLASDLRIGAEGDFKIGANETVIKMVIPVFAVELMQARLSPAYLQQSAIFGQLYDPAAAVKAGYLDMAVAPDAVLETAMGYARMLTQISGTSLTGNKRLLRKDTLERMAASLKT